MHLTITPEAKVLLDRLNTDNNHYLVLWYDTEGCGCGVNGIPTIRFTNEKDPLDIKVENEVYPILIHKQQATFFAEDMKLDVKGEMFRLSSPEGILNPFISAQSVCVV
ncbi:hypothetical protein CIL05_11915 [Virgibacillus profundi]|uniref:Core domain-containing protein n=1 Tax=Virgibacillus profundi TaxID=2024555 RepID=A0A2A2IEQ4_9BACI|nr:iron-sulfur cluster biosynthesis family protein [Virgibacillus profundi]PAV29563.1 hypothetical protein CIL05_11915 [Virgibacillus profundi]PXY53733.1 iron-sulfur cluster biosynthesis family protein [Virgibacillus profundi]